MEQAVEKDHENIGVNNMINDSFYDNEDIKEDEKDEREGLIEKVSKKEGRKRAIESLKR